MLLGAAALLTAALLAAAPVATSARHAAAEGRRVAGGDEVVHFFAIGDWGAQPYELLLNGGSMHNSCGLQKGAERCEKGSDQWDREENAQKNVMEQMRARAKEAPIHWVVNVGDNFYFEGVSSTNHWHWKSSFEEMYKDPVFRVPWLSVLGNHDYGGDCCAQDLFGGANDAVHFFSLGRGQAHVMAQVDYDDQKEWQWPAQKDTRWVMPYFNWTKIMDLGPYKVQYFAIDTNYADAAKQCVKCGGCTNSGTHREVLKRGCPPGAGSEGVGGQCACFLSRLWQEQLDWLERALKDSSKDKDIAWRFVIGHHPWNFLPRKPGGLDRFLQLLKEYGVQVLFAGHVHAMRHDIVQDNLHMVMTGSSGGYQYDGGEAPAGDPLGTTIWSSAFLDYGFAHIQMTKDQLNVTYINDRGQPRKTVMVEAAPRYYYKAQPWGECSNACGKGTHTRNLKCFHNDKEQPLEVCERQALLEKPAVVERCFATAAPAVDFCASCGGDGGDSARSCDSCAAGFEKDERGGCTNAGELVVLQLKVAAPPHDDWRGKLDGMLTALVRNVTHEQLAVHTYAVFPSEGHHRLPPAGPETHLVNRARRLASELFTVAAAVSVTPPPPPSASTAAAAVEAAASAGRRQQNSSAAELRAALAEVDPAVASAAADATGGGSEGLEILAVDSASVLCPGRVWADAEGSCASAPEPKPAPDPQPKPKPPKPPSEPSEKPSGEPSEKPSSPPSGGWFGWPMPVLLALLGAAIATATVVCAVGWHTRRARPSGGAPDAARRLSRSPQAEAGAPAAGDPSAGAAAVQLRSFSSSRGDGGGP